MATTSLKLVGKNIYLKFINGREVQLKVSTNISVNPEYWDSTREKIKNVAAVPNCDEVNSKLSKLKIHISDQYNVDFMLGEIINTAWLKKTIANFFSRPKNEENKKNLDHQLYVTSFADWWIKEKSGKWVVKSKKLMPDNRKDQLTDSINLFKKFEGKDKVRLKNFTSETLNGFSDFLHSSGYQPNTVYTNINNVKFFCKRAEEEGYEVNKSYNKRIFIEDRAEEFDEPYLNEEEISKIFQLDLWHNDNLEAIRDNFIIGLCTGLRVSDFLRRLSAKNISGEFFYIKTQKTSTDVAIPIHPYVKLILEKRGGAFPKKVDTNQFNIGIKKICQIAEIDEEIFGGVIKKLKSGEKRKVVGMYKKYELVTSHICRRSFATNHYGKLPNHIIMAITGHKTETQFLKYIKTTSKEKAVVLQKHWEDQNFK